MERAFRLGRGTMTLRRILRLLGPVVRTPAGGHDYGDNHQHRHSGKNKHEHHPDPPCAILTCHVEHLGVDHKIDLQMSGSRVDRSGSPTAGVGRIPLQL
jgi:hypothetical protein